MSNKRNEVTDLQGLARLVTDATLGITDLVENVHQQIVHPPFLRSTPLQQLITNIAAIPYKNIRRGTLFFGRTIDKLLPLLTPVLGTTPTTIEKEAARSVLNGVLGDHLEKTDNPLSITLQFKHLCKPLLIDRQRLKEKYPALQGKIIVLVHGLCMNDVQWTRKGHNHGAQLATELGKTPIYLYYNTGCHISSNGQRFNALLEKLVLEWPVPIEELVVVGHSMGGLVTRSAVHYGQQQNQTWLNYLKKIIFLGTPHHGAPLEQTGNYIDTILHSIPYSKPFSRLGKIRSAGITDLRYGNVVDEDWQGKDRFEFSGDQRKAAVLGNATNTAAAHWLGDGLVDLKSALGTHKNPDKTLFFKKENTYIAYETNHLDLLSSPKVYAQLKRWLLV